MTETARGCYVYCIVRATDRLSLDHLAGVDPEFPVKTLITGDLSAVVSHVRLDEFGEEPLRRNLESLAWLERVARAHDAVLAHAMTAEALVPLRLFTIFADESGVARMLTDERRALLDALARLQGHAEWSVKLLADPGRLDEAARERSAASSGVGIGERPRGAGHAYFARKLTDRVVREQARAIAQAAAAETHERLRDHATAARVLPPQNPELSRRSGEMVLNGAYLVDRASYDVFTAVARELSGQRRELGLDLEISGPWAPYNFVAAAEEPQ
jgi:hypothetical protein